MNLVLRQTCLDRLLAFFCRVLILGSCVGLAQAQTLYAFSDDQWSDSFKIFFGNTLAEGPYSKTVKPQKDWDPIHSKLLDLEAIPKGETLFALSNTSLQNQALLYVLDSEKGCDRGHQSLGITLSRGVVRMSQVFYEKRSRSMLVVLGEDAIDGRVHLWLFELNVRGDSLSLMRHWPLSETFSLGPACLKPFVIRNAMGALSVLWTLQQGHRGVVFCLEPETQKISKTYIQGGAFSKLSAIDQWGRGFCDALYLANEQGLWLLSLEDPGNISFKHLGHLRVHSKIMVLPNTEGMGWRLYFIGQQLNKQGLWTLEVLQEDLLRAKGSSLILEPQCLLEGAFSDLDLRSGYVWLIPDKVGKPWVWDIAKKALSPQIWKEVFSEGVEGFILGAQLVWDMQHQEHKMVLMNQEAQITLFATVLESEDTGRLAFRKY